jgi:hypothetical protein
MRPARVDELGRLTSRALSDKAEGELPIWEGLKLEWSHAKRLKKRYRRSTTANLDAAHRIVAVGVSPHMLMFLLAVVVGDYGYSRRCR